MTPLRLLALLGSLFINQVRGHGYMINPPNRASLWRIDSTQPINYNDNEYFCGGTHVHYEKNHGQCGPCGDDWRDPMPRSNENGGSFGNGIIVANYTVGSAITVSSMITANHLGSLYFHICELENPLEAETEECFKLLKLANGQTNFQISSSHIDNVESIVQLPKDLICERCVLRWHYRTGNSWGMCEDGTQNLSCGNQEIFRSCADIRILPKSNEPNESAEDKSSSEENGSGEGSSSEEDSNSSEEEHILQPCILKGILYPLNGNHHSKKHAK